MRPSVLGHGSDFIEYPLIMAAYGVICPNSMAMIRQTFLEIYWIMATIRECDTRSLNEVTSRQCVGDAAFLPLQKDPISPVS